MKAEESYPNSPHFCGLQPLRIPSGWTIEWNELDATARIEQGHFGGSSTFRARNEGRRFVIDVAFRPEHDPNGSFFLQVEYQPWLRTEKGRRRDIPIDWGIGAETVHAFETRSYAELVEQLEHWIARCTVWAREGN